MENDIWNEISSFLNQLRCENINREIRDLILELEECMEAEHLKWAEFVTAKESSKNNEKTNEDK